MGNLLYWAVVFLVIALVAAVLGFGGSGRYSYGRRSNAVFGSRSCCSSSPWFGAS